MRRFWIPIAAAFAFVWSAAPVAAETAPATGGNAADVIAALAESYHAHGLFDGVILYAEDGRADTLRAFGLADRDSRAPITPETKFSIASVTKVFTATMIAKLAEDGGLALDQPIGVYFPSLKPEIGGAVTIEHLLRHRSGLPREYAEYFSDSRDHAKNIDDVIGRLNVAPLLFAPGARESYSNANYILLGGVIEKVSGAPYFAALKSMILDKAGMTATGLDHPALVVNGRALGYSPTLMTELTRAELPAARLMTLPGAGGIYTTAGDLLRFDRALRNGGILSPESLARMVEAVGETGLGWELHDTDVGRLALATGASREGFLSAFLRFLDRDSVLVVLANSDAPGRRAFPTMIFSALAAISGADNVDVAPPTPPMQRLLEILFRDGEDAAANYYASLAAPAIVKQRAGAMQAAGAPDSGPGEAATAWASATPNDDLEWLELDYPEMIAARRVLVYQTQNPGAVAKIMSYDERGVPRELPVARIDKLTSQEGVFVWKYELRRSIPTARIRLVVDAPSIPGWNQIDAVGLVDAKGNVKWASRAIASSNEYETRSPDIFDTPSKWALTKVAATYLAFDRYEEAAQLSSLAARLFPDPAPPKARP